mmetsp:Transcript_3748/g.6961  ORF Transcript_3748/g.6961 Transcript_3748/m.6961 type:complete len:228 (-) Transcript_3748:316-999(-)
MGEVVTNSPSSNAGELAINPATDPSAFCRQRERVGTPRGAADAPFFAPTAGFSTGAGSLPPPNAPKRLMVIPGLACCTVFSAAAARDTFSRADCAAAALSAASWRRCAACASFSSLARWALSFASSAAAALAAAASSLRWAARAAFSWRASSAAAFFSAARAAACCLASSAAAFFCAASAAACCLASCAAFFLSCSAAAALFFAASCSFKKEAGGFLAKKYLLPEAV